MLVFTRLTYAYYISYAYANTYCIHCSKNNLHNYKGGISVYYRF